MTTAVFECLSEWALPDRHNKTQQIYPVKPPLFIVQSKIHTDNGLCQLYSMFSFMCTHLRVSVSHRKSGIYEPMAVYGCSVVKCSRQLCHRCRAVDHREGLLFRSHSVLSNQLKGSLSTAMNTLSWPQPCKKCMSNWYVVFAFCHPSCNCVVIQADCSHCFLFLLIP